MTTLREEKGGKKETSVSSILKLQHLQKLAKCAGVPPLAALFGHHLASNAEAAGVPLDSSWFLFQSSSERIVDSGKGASSSNKRRRKSWSSLREKAENNELHKVRNLSNIVISLHL
ncbi:hypothetical protein IHE45_01G027500 [Dioscorea alata]|uniref:Uncharacterized protein n=1 Tax=Dioscorea alata TaxID=55571 RepID=A0ACB7WTG0_DIOAL|nr:hypothetical protein IHE45_01G027500 [Dioscorea alata]